MKKILSVLLVVCIVCSAMIMVACGSDDSKDDNGAASDTPPAVTEGGDVDVSDTLPAETEGGNVDVSDTLPAETEGDEVEEPVASEELIANAVEKTEAADAVSGKMTMTVTMVAEGLTFEVPMIMDIKVKNAQSDMPITYVDMSLTMLGMEQKMVSYSENGWGYYVADGESYKAQLVTQDDEFSAMVNQFAEQLPVDIIKDKEVVDNGDGTQSVTLELTKEEFGAAFSDLVEAMYSSTMGGTDISSLELYDIIITYTVASDGYLSKCEMDYKMDMYEEELGMSMTTTVHAVMDYYSFDPAEITITPPEGYQEFPEY